MTINLRFESDYYFLVKSNFLNYLLEKLIIFSRFL